MTEPEEIEEPCEICKEKPHETICFGCAKIVCLDCVVGGIDVFCLECS